MGALRDRLTSPCTIALLAVGLMLGGLLVGYEPVGGDPDRLYRPIKFELIRALREGRLPYWSDRFGLGVALVAESHVAAFYPPNLVLYRFLGLSAAYRLAMWLHYLALVAATYAYGRALRLSPWGSSLSALAFTFCGFQAIHSSHEPFYHALPFLPLALLLTEKYVATGRSVWLALLALAWGAQLTLGHFQLPMWTAGLVLLTGYWRLIADRGVRWRVLGLPFALAWGAGIAAVQLGLSWDLAQVVGSTQRLVHDLMFFAYPPAHWPELAIPSLFLALKGGPENGYWYRQGTTGYEACLYVGTVPLILAFVGLASGRDRALAPWRLIVPLSFALASMPRWWPEGYQAILQLPGVGYFRAPGRYTLLTSLGIALLAGRGFDHAIAARRFAIGVASALAFGISAAAWAYVWSQRADFHDALGDQGLTRSLGLAAVAWALSLAVLLAWRFRRIGPVVPFVITAIELGILYYQSTTVWGWSIALPEQSPVLSRLAQERERGTVAGNLHDLPVRAGRSPTHPYLGMNLPLPNSLLYFAESRAGSSELPALRLLRRFGVTHGVWDGPVTVPGVTLLYSGPDRALDRLVSKASGAPETSTWYLVHYADVAPDVHVALRPFDAPDLLSLLPLLAQTEPTERIWFLPGDRPTDIAGPRAQSASLVSWDGRSAEVEHDGTCYLVIRRTWDPGWTARIDNGPELPVVRADGGIQAVRLAGAGRSRVETRYRPKRLQSGLVVSLTALCALAFALAIAAIRRPTRTRSGEPSASPTRQSASAPAPEPP
jgi:hypothetical protein